MRPVDAENPSRTPGQAVNINLMRFLHLDPRRPSVAVNTIWLILSMAHAWTPPARAQWNPYGVLLTARPAYPGSLLPLADGRGGLYASFGDLRDQYTNGADFYLQHLDEYGVRYSSWPASGLPGCVLFQDQGAYGLTLDPVGGLLIVSGDYRNSSVTGPDVYALRINADGSLPTGWQANGMPVCRAPAYQNPNRHYLPVIAPDCTGGMFVAWDDYRDDPLESTPNNYVQRLQADGSVAPGWPTDGRRACEMPPGRGSGPMVADGQGGVVAVFGDIRRGVPEPYDIDIYAQRIQADGQNAPGWPTDGKPLVLGFAAIRGTVPDDAGGFYVVRSKLTPASHPYDAEVWAHRFTFDGERAPGWPEQGVLVCGGPGSRYDIHVEKDAVGGLLVAWWEFRPGQTAEIYLSRILADGTLAPGWPANGLRVSNPVSQPFTDFDPAVTHDGAGGAYVTWCRDYNTISPSYIQHVLASGSIAPGWPSYGFVVAAGQEQSEPQIVTDGRGGAIVTWAQPDGYYATRFAADGPVAVELTLARSEATPDLVALEWRTGEPASFTATLERSDRPGEWRVLATLSPDGEGRLTYEDRAVTPGRRYGYRLAWEAAGARATSAEAWVETPAALELALHGFAPNPSPARASVAFTLAIEGAAQLEVFDVGGRRVHAREVGSLGVGRHVVRLDERGGLPPGLYLLRLTTPGRTVTTRGVVTG